MMGVTLAGGGPFGSPLPEYNGVQSALLEIDWLSSVIERRK